MSFFRKLERAFRPIARPAALAAAAYFAPAALPLISRVIARPSARETESIYDSPRGYFPTADSAISNPIMPGGFRTMPGELSYQYDEEQLIDIEDVDPYNCSCL